MTIYGYTRTSKAQESGHAGSSSTPASNPGTSCSDVGISGANGNSTRNQWHALDQKLCQGALLVEEGDSEANAKMRKASDHIGTLIETARQLTGGIGVRCYAG